MKCNQFHPGFGLVSACPFPTAIIITSRAQKEYKTRHEWVDKLIHMGLWKKLKFDHTNAQPSICPGKWDAQTPLRFWDTNRSPNLGQTTRPCNNHHKNKITCRIMDFAAQVDQRVKLKETKKKDMYLDLARELKKLWNIKATIIPIVIGALSTVTIGLIQGLEDLEIRGWVETIQTTALLRSARILRRVLETWDDFAVTQTPLKDHPLTLMWRTLKE